MFSCKLYGGYLKYAKIYVSLLGSQEEVKNTWAALQSSLGYLRREIGHRIKLRCTPELSFQIDKSLDHSVHIHALADGVLYRRKVVVEQNHVGGVLRNVGARYAHRHADIRFL